MDIRSFFSPTGKTTKQDVSKVEIKRGKDSTAKSASKQNVGKSRSKSKGLSSSEDDDITRKQKPKEHQKKKKGGNIIDSDSDEDPLPPKIRKATSAKKGESVKAKKSRRLISLESDEEEVVPKKLKKSAKQTETKASKEVQQVKESSVKPKEKKVTSALDFFGSTPVERESRKTFANKRKQRSDESEGSEDTLKNRKEESKKGRDKGARENGNVNGQTTEQPSKKRKEDFSEEKLDVKKPSSTPEKKKELPKKTPVSKLASKAAASLSPAKPTTTVPETPVRDSKPSPRKTVTPTKNKKDDSKKTPTKGTPKVSKSEEVDEVPPSLEKKKSGYRSFMARDGPRALGSKEIPQGAENCLEGLTFVITGVLESIEREEATDLIQRYGGKVTQSVSKKTSYVVVGRDPGESKLSKAKQCGTSQIDEDGLFELVRTKPGNVTSYEPPSVEKKSKKKEKAEPVEALSQGKDHLEGDLSQLSERSVSSPATQTPSSSPVLKGEPSLLWVDKYRPRTVKQVIGQQGDKSNMRKLMNWLRDWEKNRKKPASKSSFFKKDQDGSSFKAALLSGSPGVGKTTTATLVCEELGFTYIEMNASDTRNKKTLEEHISQSLSNKTMDGFLTGSKISVRFGVTLKLVRANDERLINQVTFSY